MVTALIVVLTVTGSIPAHIRHLNWSCRCLWWSCRLCLCIVCVSGPLTRQKSYWKPMSVKHYLILKNRNKKISFSYSFYTHPHVNTGPPTIVRSDSNHGIINMNQHHPQEDSKDSLIQQQVQHQELMEQHQHDLHDDEVDNVSNVSSLFILYYLLHFFIFTLSWFIM